MFSGGSRFIAPTYHVTDSNLTLRPYNQKLGEVTQKVCSDIEGGQASERCMFETRTAFDCVLRGKVRRQGAIMDNIGSCKIHIDNAKNALGAQAASIIDS